MSNFTASNTTAILEASARLYKYFWNGLFVALYEPIREQHTVVNLTTESASNDKFYIPMAESTIKNYLSCKTRMDFECFQEFCKGIQVDIRNMSLLDIVPYVNRALAYLEEQDFSGKASRSKTYRQRIFRETDALMDDEYLWRQELAQDEYEKAEILKSLSDLSPKELALLYRVADGYPFTCEYDDTFMDCYCRLNEKGQDLFWEVLEVEQENWKSSHHDELCDFCREMSSEPAPVLQDITVEVLRDKLEKARFNFCPEDVEKLKNYRHAEPETWQALELFHRVILSYPKENIEGLPFSEGASLLIFLQWLVSIPSLCK